MLAKSENRTHAHILVTDPILIPHPFHRSPITLIISIIICTSPITPVRATTPTPTMRLTMATLTLTALAVPSRRPGFFTRADDGAFPTCGDCW